MKGSLYKIQNKKATERHILAKYSQSGLLVGFKIMGENWTDKMVQYAHKTIPLTTADFEKFKEKFHLKIEPNK